LEIWESTPVGTCISCLWNIRYNCVSNTYHIWKTDCTPKRFIVTQVSFLGIDVTFGEAQNIDHCKHDIFIEILSLGEW